MALTREFKNTVMELCKEPNYRKGLLLEALESFLEDDIAVGNALLRDYLNGTQAFAEIARQMDMKEPSLRRMLGPNGNGRIKNVFKLFQLLQAREGIHSPNEFLKIAS